MRVRPLSLALLALTAPLLVVSTPGLAAAAAPVTLHVDSPTGGDFGRTSRSFDAAATGTTISATTDAHHAVTLLAQRGNGARQVSDTVTISAPTGSDLSAGTRATGASTGDWQARVSSESVTCSPSPGSLTITTVSWTADGALDVLDADFTFACGAHPATRVAVRYHSTNPVTALEVDLPSASSNVANGVASDVLGTVVRNTGSLPLTISAVTLAADDSTTPTPLSEWSIGSETCTGGPVPVDGSCHVDLRLTATASGDRRVLVHLVDSTTATSHDRLVSVVAKDAPHAAGSVTTSNVFATDTHGAAVDLAWTVDSAAPQKPDTFRVLRGSSASALTPIGHGPATTTSFRDSDYTTGVRYYAVELVNVAGATRSTPVRVEIARAAPTNLVASGLAWRVGLTWDAPTTYYSAPITGYVVYAGPSTNLMSRVGTTPPSRRFFSVRGISPGTRVYAQVFAVYGSEYGLWSNAASAVAASSQLVTVDDHDQLLAMPTAGGPAVPYATSGLSGIVTPSVSRDGRWIAFSASASGGDNDIYVIAADGSGSALRRTASTDDVEPAWSGDGKTLVFTGFNLYTGASQLYRMGASSGVPVAIANSSDLGQAAFIGMTPWMVAADFSAADAPLTLISTTGEQADLGIAGAPHMEMPTVSLDTTQLAYIVSDPTALAASTLQVVSLVDGTQTSISVPAGAYASPSFSRDGRSIALAVLNLTTHTSDVWVVDSAGGAVRRVAATAGNEYGVVVSTPDRTAPVVRLTAPSATTTTATTVRVTWSASDLQAGVLSSDVRYRRGLGSGPLGPYSSPAGWTATTKTTQLLAVAKGYRYCFSVRARDRAGNTSGWSAERCVTVR